MANDIQRLVRLDRVALGDLLRAGFELGIARLRLHSKQVRNLIAALPSAPTTLDPDQVASVERVAFAIPRVAVRLPWRANCLVQALAARRWLARDGISTALHLGVRNGRPGDLDAHAWLTAGDRVVIGGEIGDYVPLRRN